MNEWRELGASRWLCNDRMWVAYVRHYVLLSGIGDAYPARMTARRPSPGWGFLNRSAAFVRMVTSVQPMRDIAVLSRWQDRNVGGAAGRGAANYASKLNDRQP
ncbi:hypothetical protein GCM10009106_02730 [Sphingomonas japonica]